MAAAGGKSLYGQVDRVPGQFYVSTMFWWINWFPIAPVQTWLVFEGSESRGDFRGKPIPFVGKSILMGYLRGWLGAATFILYCVAGFNLLLYCVAGFNLLHGTVWTILAPISPFAGAGLVWFIMNHQTWGALLIPVSLLAASVGLSAGWLDLDSGLHETLHFYIRANAIATVASFTRLFTAARYARALQLADEFGIDRQPIKDYFRIPEP